MEGIGHNHPPTPSPGEIAAYLADTQRPLLLRRDELLAGLARFHSAYPSIDDSDVSKKAGDFNRQMDAVVKAAKEQFTPVKKPYVEAGRAIDQFFAAITGPLTAGMKSVNDKITTYKLKLEAEERARRWEEAKRAEEQAAEVRRRLAEQERAEKQAAWLEPTEPEVTIEEAIVAADHAERAAKAASVKAAELTRERSDSGSVSSLREVWEVELLNIAMVPAEFLLFNQTAARRAAQGGVRDIPGCRVYCNKVNVTR